MKVTYSPLARSRPRFLAPETPLCFSSLPWATKPMSVFSGVISVSSNVFPAEVQKMCRLALANDFAAARKLHEFWYPMNKMLFVETNPVPVKAALADLGLIEEEYRLPLCEMAPKNRELLREAMRKTGLLK